jgi:hypothetical protein
LLECIMCSADFNGSWFFRFTYSRHVLSLIPNFLWSCLRLYDVSMLFLFIGW